MGKSFLQSIFGGSKEEDRHDVSVTQEANGCVVVNISGVFAYEDLEKIQTSAKQMYEPGTRINVLIRATEFGGWGKGGNWGDLTFMHEVDEIIDRMAVVSEERWKDELMMFVGAGRRKAAVRFFFPEDEKVARRWVGAA